VYVYVYYVYVHEGAGVQECRSAGLGVVCADAVAGADVGVLGVGV
jgi:hypothetical protein